MATRTNKVTNLIKYRRSKDVGGDIERILTIQNHQDCLDFLNNTNIADCWCLYPPLVEEVNEDE